MSTRLQVQQRIDASGSSRSARDQLPQHDEDLSLQLPAAKQVCGQCLDLRSPTASIGAFGGPDGTQRRDHDTPINMVAAEIAISWLPTRVSYLGRCQERPELRRFVLPMEPPMFRADVSLHFHSPQGKRAGLSTFLGRVLPLLCSFEALTCRLWA